jgi:dienelactone hydrolase
MASLIHGYEYDIFISYRQNDNKYDGWVTEFIDNLNKELEATSKDKINIYFDSNPHDGLLETHLVSKSLEDKLKCLVFIPILSRTYCDPNSFAWNSEFLAFIKIAEQEKFGLNIKLGSGNFASRIFPVRIHDLDPEDIKLVETHLGFIRSVDFIYRAPGVNRPLSAHEDHPQDNLNKTYYRDQINRVANAVNEVIHGLKVYKTIPREEIIKPGDHVAKAEIPKGIKTPDIDYKKKPEPSIKKNRTLRSQRSYGSIKAILIIVVILIVSFFSLRYYYFQKKREYARNDLIPQIQKMTEENFTAPFRAFELAMEAEKYIPDDSVLIQLWPKISALTSLKTQPEGAGLYWKDYDHPEDPWIFIGETPLKDFRIPYGSKRMKIEKEGFNTIIFTHQGLFGQGNEKTVKLDSIGLLPEKLVRIPSQVSWMNLVGVETHGGKSVSEFIIDRYEVTNKEFKKFVDAGGYENKNFWPFSFFLEGKEITWEEAMRRFVDKTGKQGPASWEVGTFSEGQEDHPVSGISWYEASAYAAFAGKQLPTLYHWSIVAETSKSMNIIPKSNFNGKSTVPVGSLDGISSYGIYDLAGNVREWCENGNGVNGESYISGGGYNDATYSFNDAYTQPSFDRSPSNGLRCIMTLPGDTTYAALSEPIRRDFRDYRKEKPVDDNTFKLFLRQYNYDKTPLNPGISVIEETEIWKVEKVTIDAGYNNERLDIYLFSPRETKPPYQPVVFFSGSGVIFTEAFKTTESRGMDFIVKSGRVLVFPVLKGTFERRDELKSDYQAETVFYKDHMIMWRRDLGRTIDYLETRRDILSDKIGFFGWSWGGFLGGIMPALEKRIKVVVLNVGGMEMTSALPEADQINFLPRVTQPVLMLNGNYDMYFPVETSQKPMFDFLGTPSKDKKMLVYNTGHLVTRTDLIRETLNWFDIYLGPVKK